MYVYGHFGSSQLRLTCKPRRFENLQVGQALRHILSPWPEPLREDPPVQLCGSLVHILFGNLNLAGHAPLAVPHSPNTAHDEDSSIKKKGEAGRLSEGPGQDEDEEPIAQTDFDENPFFGIERPRSPSPRFLFCFQAESARGLADPSGLSALPGDSSSGEGHRELGIREREPARQGDGRRPCGRGDCRTRRGRG